MIKNILRKTLPLVALVGIACGGSGTIGDERSSCASDADCKGDRVCVEGICSDSKDNSPTSNVDQNPPELCCGKFIYTNYSNFTQLFQFDLDTKIEKELTNYPPSTTGYSIEEMAVSSDYSTLVLSISNSGCDAPFYLVRSDGQLISERRFNRTNWTGCLEDIRSLNLLSDNQTIVAAANNLPVLAFRLGPDSVLREFPFLGETQHGRLVVSPQDDIYYVCTINGQISLCSMDAEGGSQKVIGLLDVKGFIGRMYWLGDTDQILMANGNLPTSERYFIIDPQTARTTPLSAQMGRSPEYSEIIVSPRGNSFLFYDRGYYLSLVGIPSGLEVEIEKNDFPDCDNSCLRPLAGVWIP